MTAPTECPVAWCDESGTFHTIHRRYVRSIQFSGGEVSAIPVAVAAIERTDRHLELILTGTFAETVIELTLGDGRSLGEALSRAAIQRGRDTRLPAVSIYRS